MTTELPPLLTLAALLDPLGAEADRVALRALTGRPAGPVTGIAPLDEALGGHLAAGLHVLHGAPGTGKTALALQVAATCGVPALLVTCELAPLDLLRRIIARVTGTYLGRLRSGELDGEAVLALGRRAVEAVPWLAILDATQGASPIVEDLHAAIEAVRDLANRGGEGGRRAADTGALLVVDSGHAWASGLAVDGGGVPEYDRLNKAIGGLHQLARVEGVAVLVTAERNRAAMATGGMNAAAGTRAWEYRAETVLALAPDDADTGHERRVTLSLPKNRHGPPVPAISLAWEGRVQRFRARR